MIFFLWGKGGCSLNETQLLLEYMVQLRPISAREELSIKLINNNNMPWIAWRHTVWIDWFVVNIYILITNIRNKLSYEQFTHYFMYFIWNINARWTNLRQNGIQFPFGYIAVSISQIKYPTGMLHFALWLHAYYWVHVRSVQGLNTFNKIPDKQIQTKAYGSHHGHLTII